MFPRINRFTTEAIGDFQCIEPRRIELFIHPVANMSEALRVRDKAARYVALRQQYAELQKQRQFLINDMKEDEQSVVDFLVQHKTSFLEKV